MRKKIQIPKKDLVELYYKQKKSKYKIGRIYKCSAGTILNRMRDYNMKSLPRSIIQSKYKKQNFSGDLIEKAYLIGFRLGDLNVYKTVHYSEVLIARTHTTKADQLKLMQKLFTKYGKVSYSHNSKNKSYHLIAI